MTGRILLILTINNVCDRAGVRCAAQLSAGPQVERSMTGSVYIESAEKMGSSH